MPNLLKQLKRRTHWVSNNIIQTFQYIQNKSAEERYKVFKTIILCILFGCTDWLEKNSLRTSSLNWDGSDLLTRWQMPWSCTRFSVLEGVSRMNFYFCWDYRMRTLGIAAISRMDFGFPSLKKMELCYKSQLRFKFCWVFCCCCFFSSQIIKF